MRISLFGLIPIISLTATAIAQIPSQQRNTVPSYKVVERGEHHRVWAMISSHTNSAGRVFTRTNSYTELATGMHHKIGNQWVESSDDITITADGATATRAAHQVSFSGDANATNAIRLTMPNGQVLSSHVVGVSYFDTATGSNVMVADLQSSIGQALPSGQVLYSQALTGDFSSDLLYKFSRSGLEQNIIIRTKPTSPAEYGLNPATTMLQVWTEFIAPPSPVVLSLPARKATLANGQTLTDIELKFGTMKIGAGSAFSVGDQSASNSPVRVIKEWVTIDSRKFLVEQVPLSALAAALSALPETPATVTNSPHAALRPATGSSFVPPVLLASNARRSVQRATLEPTRAPGVLIDYSILTSQTNFVLQSDTTYYVTGPVNLSGSTVIEGGTVVKFTNSSSATLNILGRVSCKTGPYRMAVFTSKDDGTVGQAISGASGNPTNFPGQTFLSRGGSSSRYQLC